MRPIELPYLSELVALRRDLHAHPELAYKETRTAEIVARELAAYGLEVHRGLAGTGVVGVLRQGDSPRAIGLRADMAALPLQEKNDFPYRSRHPGAMHGCGHDGHTAMLLGAAAPRRSWPQSPTSTAPFIFCSSPPRKARAAHRR